MLSRSRKALAVALVALCAPFVAHSGADQPTANGSIAGYVDDGDYRPSFEMMEINPPVSWLSEWLVV